MLLSEITASYFVITWDNPDPAHSGTMLAALQALGRFTECAAKTSGALAPRANVSYLDVLNAVETNLNSSKGRAIVADIDKRQVWHIDKADPTNPNWSKAVP